MRNLKLVEWIAVAAALVVISLFVFPSWFQTIFFPSSTTTPAAQSAAAINSAATTSESANIPTNMKNISNISGLTIYDITAGTGPAVTSGSQVTVNYVGALTDGTVFDSNINSKFGHEQPFPFTVGAGQVIKGWDEGLIGMKVGGTRELIISPNLGYGDNQVGPIPANSTLVFQVQLLSVK